MAKTKRELVSDALVALRVIGAAETPTAEDYDEVADTYDDVLAELRDEGLCYWPNTGNDVAEIPQSIFQALVLIVAHDCSDAFGKDSPTVQREGDGAELSARNYGLARLRRHMRKRRSGESTPFSLF